MVDNSLSLDQLKQKTKYISLKDFYLNYFSKRNVNNILFKKAMNNYVSSLSGYSLVCYFSKLKIDIMEIF